MTRALLLALLLAGCATAPEIRETPGASCDDRVLDLNRRLCTERGGVFLHPSGAPCGQCVAVPGSIAR